jgi:hypothetical protein
MAAKSLLVVEGVEDQLFFKQICREGGLGVCDNIKCDPSGKGNAISAFVNAIQLNAYSNIGLVVDADFPVHGAGLAATVQLINQKLVGVGVKPMALRAGGGYEAASVKPAAGRKTGVWVMPNNALDGYLEDLLKTFVAPAYAATFNHAAQATATALAAGVGFTAKPLHRPKADLGAFLAWHDVPRMSFGKALSGGYFVSRQPSAGALINWLNWLYQ